jgi:hypothetical protein
MLIDKQIRNGLTNPASRWPNKIVPYVIDSVFSEYCSTKLQSGMGKWKEISCILNTVLDPGYTGG